MIQVGPDPTFADLALRGHRSAVAICSGVSSAIAALGRARDRARAGDLGLPPAPAATRAWISRHLDEALEVVRRERRQALVQVRLPLS